MPLPGDSIFILGKNSRKEQRAIIPSTQYITLRGPNLSDKTPPKARTRPEGNENIAKDYLAEYKMLQMKTAHELGGGKEESQFKARRSTWNNLTESEREQMRANPRLEFTADDGTFDTFKFLGYTS